MAKFLGNDLILSGLAFKMQLVGIQTAFGLVSDYPLLKQDTPQLFPQCPMNYEVFCLANENRHCLGAPPTMRRRNCPGSKWAVREFTSAASLRACCPFLLEIQFLESHWFIYFVLYDSCSRYWINLALLILPWLEQEALRTILLILIWYH